MAVAARGPRDTGNDTTVAASSPRPGRGPVQLVARRYSRPEAITASIRATSLSAAAW